MLAYDYVTRRAIHQVTAVEMSSLLLLSALTVPLVKMPAVENLIQRLGELVARASRTTFGGPSRRFANPPTAFPGALASGNSCDRDISTPSGRSSREYLLTRAMVLFAVAELFVPIFGHVDARFAAFRRVVNDIFNQNRAAGEGDVVVQGVADKLRIGEEPFRLPDSIFRMAGTEAGTLNCSDSISRAPMNATAKPAAIPAIHTSRSAASSPKAIEGCENI